MNHYKQVCLLLILSSPRSGGLANLLQLHQAVPSRPRTTPFLERLEDVRRVFLALPSPYSLAFALGAFGGLRPGEVYALRWPHVDLAARRIHVREQTKGRLKDSDSRIVPVLDALLPVLKAAHLAAGGKGLVVAPPGRQVRRQEPGREALRAALEHLGLTQRGSVGPNAPATPSPPTGSSGGRPMSTYRRCWGTRPSP